MTAAVATTKSFAQRTLASIAATLPGATPDFRRLKLDFCCGGDVSLADAARREKISPCRSWKQSSRPSPQQRFPPDVPRQPAILIAMIETRYHAVHRRELPEMIKLRPPRGGGPQGPSLCPGGARLLARTNWPRIWKITCARRRWSCSR